MGAGKERAVLVNTMVEKKKQLEEQEKIVAELSEKKEMGKKASFDFIIKLIQKVMAKALSRWRQAKNDGICAGLLESMKELDNQIKGITEANEELEKNNATLTSENEEMKELGAESMEIGEVTNSN